MSLGSGWRLPRTVSCGPEGRALQPGSGGGSARLEPEAAWRSPAGAGPASRSCARVSWHRPGDTQGVSRPRHGAHSRFLKNSFEVTFDSQESCNCPVCPGALRSAAHMSADAPGRRAGRSHALALCPSPPPPQPFPAREPAPGLLLVTATPAPAYGGPLGSLPRGLGVFEGAWPVTPCSSDVSFGISK